MQALKSNISKRGECAHLINHYRSMINEASWEVKVVHVYRQGNRVADWLANHGMTQPQRTLVLEDIPITLTRILDEDNRDVAFPRFIPH